MAMAFSSLLIESLFAFGILIPSLQAHQLIITSRPAGPLYIEQGSNFILNVSFTYTGTKEVEVYWIRGNDFLVFKRHSGIISTFNNKSSIYGDVNLRYVDATLLDNGTYSIHLAALDANNTARLFFNVFVLAKPTAVISCSTPSYSSTQEKFSCRCSGENGNPPARASWFKDEKRIGTVGFVHKQLSLTEVHENGGGMYICRVKSYDNVDEEMMKISVERNSKGMLETTLLIGSTDDQPKKTHTGIGSKGIKPYFIVIALSAGCCLGVIGVFAVKWLKNKISMKRSGTKSAQDSRASLNSGIREPEQNQPSGIYQELQLGDMGNGENYQSLLANRPRNPEYVTVVHESNYEELDGTKRTEEKYKSLIRS